MVKEDSQPLAPKEWQLTVGEHGEKKKTKKPHDTLPE